MKDRLLSIGIIKKVHTWINTYAERKTEKDARSRINNTSFTLLTPTCMGGIIYHKLGLRFESPTINTWFNKKDFVRFCKDLHYYTEQRLVFFDNPNKEFPCAYLGEGDRRISVSFVHYKTEEEARSKWVERCNRIIWDSIYIISSDGNGFDKDDLEIFDKIECKRKLLFVAQEWNDKPYSFILHSLKRDGSADLHQLRKNPITGLRTWEYEFDFVAWLNGEDEYRLNPGYFTRKLLGIKKS